MNSESPNLPPPTRTSGLAIGSLVLGLLGCLLLPAPIAVILGIIALVQIGKDPNLRGQGLAIAGGQPFHEQDDTRDQARSAGRRAPGPPSFDDHASVGVCSAPS